MEIKEAIQRLARKGGGLPTILIGKVKSFEEGKWLATIEFNAGFTDDDIRVRAVIDSNESGILVKPKIGSMVLCAQIEGKKESMVVLTWSEIELFKIVSPKVELVSDSFGGLVKSEKVASEINALKLEINKLKQILTAWIPVLNDGGTALKSAVAPWAGQQLQNVQKSTFENNKVQHGE